jgi:hypothetical protein
MGRRGAVTVDIERCIVSRETMRAFSVNPIAIEGAPLVQAEAA